MSIIRTRWAAIGAAVAVTLGAGGIGIVSATQPDDAVTFVPITPCRVMDTRTEFNVGPKTSPVGPGEVYTVNTTTGNTGDCTDIPTTATGLSLNITALDATMPTFLTIWATGQPQPEASSLNPVPGQPPTPNAVTTAINPGGQFDIYNLDGNVHVVADINGYYTDHHHDDRYYTKDEADIAFLARIEALEASRPFAVSSTAASSNALTNVPTAMLDVTLTAPVDGQVVINYSALVAHNLAQRDVRCAPFRSTESPPGVISGLTPGVALWKRPADASSGSISGTRLFDIAAGETMTYSLLCHEFDQDGGLISGRAMTAIFTPAP